MKHQSAIPPTEAINIFFGDFDKDNAREYLWELYRGWVMSERSRNCDPGLPADILFFYIQMGMLIEASWEIQAPSVKVKGGGKKKWRE